MAFIFMALMDAETKAKQEYQESSALFEKQSRERHMQIEKLTETLNNKASQIGELKTEVDQSKTKIQRLEADIESQMRLAREAHLKLEELHEDMRQQLELKDAECAEKMTVVDQQLSELQQRCEADSSVIKELQTLLGEAAEDLEASYARQSELERECTAIGEMLQQTQSQIEEQRAQIESNEQESERLVKKLAQLETALSESTSALQVGQRGNCERQQILGKRAFRRWAVVMCCLLS